MSFFSFQKLFQCRKDFEAPHAGVFKSNESRMSSQQKAEQKAAEEEEAKAERAEENRERQRNTELLKAQVSRSKVSEEAKQTMRRLIATGNIEYLNKVENFLAQENPNEKEFLQDIEGIEREDASWRTIFTIQREVRKSIQNLQWKTMSYGEIMPRQKTKFDDLLKNVRHLNLSDDSTDRSLKRILQGLISPPGGAAQILGAEGAREILHAGGLSVGLEGTLKKYQSAIEAAPNISPYGDGKKIFQKIVALKKEEARIEAQFHRLSDRLTKMVEVNLSKVRRKAEKEKILEDDSKLIGITLKKGVKMEYNDGYILGIITPNKDAVIESIKYDDIPIRDMEGKVVDIRQSIPIITVRTPDGPEEMTIGRFKKWADATSATEKISTVGDIERATGLIPYGINVRTGMEISYPRRYRKDNGEMETVLENVKISAVDETNKRITFDRPVMYQPGFDTGTDYDLRDTLTYGEFVKWWHRYEVESSVSLEQLKKHLATYNELENKRFGLEPSDNPPILLEKDLFEEMTYPDDSDTVYKITNIDDQGVSLDGLGKKSLPEFFYWVKNNHVRKVPEKKKSADEQADDIKRKAEIHEREHKQEHEKAHDEAAGKLREERAEKEKERREAGGSPLDRIKEIWWTTQLLSIKDLWHMTTTVVDFIKRKHQRRSKGRFGSVGSRLPGVLGTEFEREKQSAETEEVNKYKEAMEHWSVMKVKETLYATNSSDEAKACIMTLLHHGEMRWDDHELWATLNRLTARYTLRGAKLYIPPPDKMPHGQSGEDMAAPAMDELWGTGTASQWFQENISKYNSNKNNFEFKFKQLENDPKGTGGPTGECINLLRKWRRGEYVNPQDYEEMIDGAIKYGKMSAESKMFFIMAGVLTRYNNDPRGETLLHIDRIGELNTRYNNQFPLLDYFTQVYVTDYSMWDAKANKYGKKRKLNLKDLEKLMIENFPDDFEKGEAGAQFSRFLWETMLMEDEVRTRMSKGMRNAENIDHEDAPLFIPPLTPSEIDQITTGPTGQKKYFTNEGYMNAYAGFNQYFVSLGYALDEELDPEKKKYKSVALRDAIYSFVRFDTTLDNRLHREEGDRRARLDDRHYQKTVVVDRDVTVGLHQKQMQDLVVKVGEAYNEDWHWLYAEKFGVDAEGKAKQKIYEQKIEQLKDRIKDLIEQDNGARALSVIKQKMQQNEDKEVGLRGLKSSRRPSAEALEKMKDTSRRMKAELSKAHGGH